MKVRLHEFLTDNWMEVGSCETAHSIQIEGLVGPSVGIESVKERKVSVSAGKLIPTHR
jgi:hypothetical protein